VLMKNKQKAPSSPKEPIPFPEDDAEPPPAGEAIRDDFTMALMAGNAAAGAKALRKLDELPRLDLETLADLFDGDPILSSLFPYRLKLVPRKRGKPPMSHLLKQAEEQVIARTFASAIAKFKKQAAAIAHVQHQYALGTGKKLSRSKILRCFAAHKEKFQKKSP
jgi:hypothetical protein